MDRSHLEDDVARNSARRSKRLDSRAKASLKIALGSMMLTVGVGGAECAFASTTLPTVVVTATPSDGPGGPRTPVAPPCNNAVSRGGLKPNCAGGPTQPPGGGGGGSTSVTLPEIKVTATAIKNKICTMSPDSKESLSFEYVNAAGNLTFLNPIPGTGTVTVNLNSLGVPINGTVSMVHNHPKNIYGSNPAEWVPSKQDWETYNNIRGAGAPMQGQFLMGPDHILRYFDGTNKNYPGTYQYPASGGALPTGVIVAGGNC